LAAQLILRSTVLSERNQLITVTADEVEDRLPVLTGTLGVADEGLGSRVLLLLQILLRVRQLVLLLRSLGAILGQLCTDLGGTQLVSVLDQIGRASCRG